MLSIIGFLSVFLFVLFCCYKLFDGNSCIQTFACLCDYFVRINLQKWNYWVKGNVDFKGIIVKNVDAFSLEKLEEVTYTLAAREFKHIEVIGAILGAIIGFVQFIIGMIM